MNRHFQQQFGNSVSEAPKVMLQTYSRALAVCGLLDGPAEPWSRITIPLTLEVAVEFRVFAALRSNRARRVLTSLAPA